MTQEGNLPSDQELVKRTLTGDRDSYEVLYQRYSRLILWRCTKLMNGDVHTAKDLTQDTFSIALCRLSCIRLDKPESFKAYLLWLAKICAIDKIRRRKRERKVLEDRLEHQRTIDKTRDDPIELARKQEHKLRVHNAINKMPDELMRKCMTDRYILEMSRIDICRSHFLTLNQLDHLLRKGRKFIQEELDEYE